MMADTQLAHQDLNDMPDHTLEGAAARLEKMFEEIDENEGRGISGAQEDPNEKEIRADAEALPGNEEIKDEGTDEPSKDASATEAEKMDDPETPGQDTETETLNFERLDQLAEATDMKFDDFMNTVKTQVTVQGVTSEVNLNELKNGYQRDSDYQRKTTNLAERRKTFESESEAASKSLTDRTIQLDGLIRKSEEMLISDFNNVNWGELREIDPGDYAAKRQDFAERQTHIDGIKNEALSTFNQRMKEQDDKTSIDDKSYKEKERKALLDEFPEWHDETKYKAGTDEIRGYLSGSGFSDNELEAISDHRIVQLVNKAMKFDALKKNGDVAQKKVVNLPKLLRPGSKQTKGQLAVGARTERMKTLRKSGRVEDAADYLFDLMDE